ncbi:aminoacyl-tRNA hydrolase [Candidatus Uhrbacteria bacterium]|nr:aminoacyl-tRNA hydrolase [Candidatus Uhrbacteria bacterium]
MEHPSTSTPDQVNAHNRLLVVGLGNPGPKYENTRHNIGFSVLDTLVDNWKDDKKHKALSSKRFIDGVEVHFLKPQTFMNLSGEAVQSYAAYYEIENDGIIVVHDDADISFGEIRTKIGGGHAGHNGLKSIDNRLGTKDYWRIRVGIGRPPEKMPMDAYVLARWTNDQKAALPTLIEHATHEVDQMLVKVQEPNERQNKNITK